MTSHPLLPEEMMIQKAVYALVEALGPVEAARFLNLSRHQELDAVAWHRQWQENLDAIHFFDEVFGPEADEDIAAV